MNESKKVTIETAPAAPPAAPKTLSRGDLKATTGGRGGQGQGEGNTTTFGSGRNG